MAFAGPTEIQCKINARIYHEVSISVIFFAAYAIEGSATESRAYLLNSNGAMKWGSKRRGVGVEQASRKRQ